MKLRNGARILRADLSMPQPDTFATGHVLAQTTQTEQIQFVVWSVWNSSGQPELFDTETGAYFPDFQSAQANYDARRL